MLAEIRDKQAHFDLYQDARLARRERGNAKRRARKGMTLHPAEKKTWRRTTFVDKGFPFAHNGSGISDSDVVVQRIAQPEGQGKNERRT